MWWITAIHQNQSHDNYRELVYYKHTFLKNVITHEKQVTSVVEEN